jgi:HEAT repeat protein
VLSLIAEASGVLVRQGHSYRFTDESFVEYLAGRYVAELSITQDEVLRELLTFHAWDPRWTRVFVFAMGRLWSERRELAWCVVLWLIAHVDNGRDDVWSTLTMLAARLLSPCEAPHDKTEERIANEVARMTIQAWRSSVHNRAGFASETAAHGVLIGLLPVAQKTIIDGLRAQLGDEHVGAAAAAALGLAATDEALQLLQETSVTGNTPAIRSAAVESLHRIGSNGARDWITRSLRDESHTVRHQAIRALQEAGDGDAIAALVSVLTEQGASVDSCVIEVLGAIRSSAAVDPLLELMADSSADPYIRTLGAEALGRIGATRAAEPLANVLRTANDTSLRDAALRGLAGIPSDIAVAAAIDVLHHRISASLFDAIRVLGICASDQAEQALLHVLAHEEEGLLRSVAALALGKIGSSRAVHALVTALGRESEPQARRDIVYALGDTRAPDAVDVLLKAVGDADRVTSLLAGLALMPILGSDQAVTVLVGAMAHAEVQVRRNIPQVLAWLGSPAASPCKTDTYNVPIETAKELRWAVVQHGVTGLIQAISDSDAAVRTGAVEALRDLAPNRVLDSLLTCLTDSEARVRREAATALAKVDGDAAAGPLIAALVDAVPEVRQCAAGSLGALGCMAAEQALLERLADESPVVRSAAAKALGEVDASNAERALIGLLTDQESIVRYDTAMALGHVGTEAAVERLIETLGDPVADVRWQAADALGAIGSDRGVEPLTRALTDPDTLARKAAAHALGRIGSVKALTPLLNMLDDASKDNRAWAARALGMIGDKRAVGSLLAHLTDREYINFVDLPTQVADVAADALAALGIDSILPKLVTDLVGEDFERATGAYRLLMRTKSPAVIVALVSALNDERGWAGHLLDKYQLQSGETVFIDGRVAREEALSLEATLWPPL